MTAAEPSRRGPGRRPGAGDTRGEILEAARTEFSQKGYDGASVRGIARAASVDPALVHHYFGTKEQVFVAAMRLPFDPAELLPRALAGDPSGLGERLARLFLSVWANRESREPMLAMLRSATTGEQGAAMLREFVAAAMLSRVTEGVEGSDARLRAQAAAAQMVGVVLLRYVVRMEPIATVTDDEVVALVAPALQRFLVDGG